MIGVLVADKNELNQFPFNLKETKVINQFTFWVFDNGVVAVHSGIGIANAAAATQEIISSFKVKELINYGAVGGNKHVNVYDVVTPAKIFFHDVITPWYKRGQTPGEKEFFVNATSSSRNNNLASGSSFVTDKEAIKSIKAEIDCDIFDMETAAMAQIADKNNVPLSVIKCVSDSIGHTDASVLDDINTRIANAGKIAFDKAIELIKTKVA